MNKLKDSVTKNVESNKEGLSVILINNDTNEKTELPYFMLVGFDDGGEFVSNQCTIPQLAQGLLRLQDLYDKLKMLTQIKDKPRLTLLSPVGSINKKD